MAENGNGKLQRRPGVDITQGIGALTASVQLFVDFSLHIQKSRYISKFVEIFTIEAMHYFT